MKDGKDDHIATFDHVENPKGETVGEGHADVQVPFLENERLIMYAVDTAVHCCEESLSES